MKKVFYGLYVLVMAGVLCACWMGKLSVDAAFMFYLGVGIIVMYFCIGGFFPTKMSVFETPASLQNKVEGRNDPIPWLLGLYLMTPVILGILITYII